VTRRARTELFPCGAALNRSTSAGRAALPAMRIRSFAQLYCLNLRTWTRLRTGLRNARRKLFSSMRLDYRPVPLHKDRRRERRESVRGAFATHPGSQVDNRRVLLVDDVKTTGATLDACAKALARSG